MMTDTNTMRHRVKLLCSVLAAAAALALLAASYGLVCIFALERQLLLLFCAALLMVACAWLFCASVEAYNNARNALKYGS